MEMFCNMISSGREESYVSVTTLITEADGGTDESIRKEKIVCFRHSVLFCQMEPGHKSSFTLHRKHRRTMLQRCMSTKVTIFLSVCLFRCSKSCFYTCWLYPHLKTLVTKNMISKSNTHGPFSTSGSPRLYDFGIILCKKKPDTYRKPTGNPILYGNMVVTG